MSEVPLYPPARENASTRHAFFFVLITFAPFVKRSKRSTTIYTACVRGRSGSLLPWSNMRRVLIVKRSKRSTAIYTARARGRGLGPSLQRDRPPCPCASSSLLGPVVPSFRALSGRLKFTVRRHKFNKDCLSVQRRARLARRCHARLQVCVINWRNTIASLSDQQEEHPKSDVSA